MSTPEFNEAASRLQSFVEILLVSVRRPRMTLNIPRAEVLVDGVTLTESATTAPCLRMCPASLNMALQRIESRVNALLQQYAVGFRSRTTNGTGTEQGTRFELRGLHIVPTASVETLLQRLSALDTELRTTIREHCGDAQRFHDAIKAHVNNDTLFTLMKHRIPTLDSMLRHSGVLFTSVPIGANAEQLQSAASSRLLQLARERASVMIQDVAENLVAAPRQELANALTELEDLIRRNGRVTTKSFEPIRRCIVKMRAFDFAMDDALASRIAHLERTFEDVRPAEQTLQVATDNGLLAAVQNVTQAALSEAVIGMKTEHVVGKRRRVFNFAADTPDAA